MQKIDLRNNLYELKKGLKSSEIVAILDLPHLTGGELITRVIESKSAYDKATTEPEKTKVFNQFKVSELYSTGNFSNILTFLSSFKQTEKLPRTHFLNNNSITRCAIEFC